MKKYNISREEYKSKWTGLPGQFLREKDGERKKKSGQASNEVDVQCSKLAVVRSSETTKKFTGQPLFSKIKSLAVLGKNNEKKKKK